MVSDYVDLWCANWPDSLWNGTISEQTSFWSAGSDPVCHQCSGSSGDPVGAGHWFCNCYVANPAGYSLSRLYISQILFAGWPVTLQFCTEHSADLFVRSFKRACLYRRFSRADHRSGQRLCGTDSGSNTRYQSLPLLSPVPAGMLGAGGYEFCLRYFLRKWNQTPPELSDAAVCRKSFLPGKSQHHV